MKDGNLITDGRIISRTIDELWEMIKKLVGGRKSTRDAQIDTSLGYPYGTGQLDTRCDTRPIIKSHKFTNDGQTFITPKNFIFALPVGFKLDVGKEYKSFILKYAMQTAERGNVFNE